MNDIKAIETRYRGFLFRSRTEARWAVYLDAEKIKWEYEREGYKLPSGWYLPDFWLPQVNMWAEVKPGPFTPLEMQLCRELAQHTKRPVLMLEGPPEVRSYESIEENGERIEYVVSNYHNYPENERRFYSYPGEIRNAPGSYSQRARRFGVSKSLVAQIARGEVWT